MFLKDVSNPWSAYSCGLSSLLTIRIAVTPSQTSQVARSTGKIAPYYPTHRYEMQMVYMSGGCMYTGRCPGIFYCIMGPLSLGSTTTSKTRYCFDRICICSTNRIATRSVSTLSLSLCHCYDVLLGFVFYRHKRKESLHLCSRQVELYRVLTHRGIDY